MKCYWAIKQSKVSNTNPQKSKNSSASTKNSTTNGYNESAQWSIMKMVSHHKWCEQPNNTWQTLQQVTLGQLVLEDCSFNQEWPALVSWATLFKAKVRLGAILFLWRKDVRAGYFITGQCFDSSHTFDNTFRSLLTHDSRYSQDNFDFFLSNQKKNLTVF